jgi:haloalkane dehalogenase
MHALRTPDDRFRLVPDFAYPPSYVDVGDDLRMAYVQDGPTEGQIVVLLHGEPTWSFLWRSVIPVLTAAGLRVVAPDLIGFGRSDKPAEIADHSYARHVEWVRSALFDALDLRAVTLVGHDWGGLIGMRLATEHSDRVSRFVATNTGLPTGDQQMPDLWLRFREAVRTAPVLDIARLVHSGCQVVPSAAVLAAYDAPFPDETYKAAARAMPSLVPTAPDDPASAANRTAWQALSTWDKPFLLAFSDRDPITGGAAPILARTVPGARSVTIPGAGHFLQEDAGPLLGDEIARFVLSS